VFGRYLVPVLPMALVVVPQVWKPRQPARVDALLLGYAAVLGVAGVLSVT
jgi:hypothetical protein